MSRKRIYLWYIPLLKELWMFVLDKETHYINFNCMAVIFIVKIDLLIVISHITALICYMLCVLSKLLIFFYKLSQIKSFFLSYSQTMSDAFRNYIMIYFVWERVSKEIMTFKSTWETKWASFVYAITYFNC